jgi:acyl carrier protein
MDSIEKRVRSTVAAALGGDVDIAGLDGADNLYEAGMTSHQTVQVMLGLEDEFDLRFSDADLAKPTFATIGAMVDAVAALS